MSSSTRARTAQRRQVAEGLATALLAGNWAAPVMIARATESLGMRSPPRWLKTLVGQVLDGYRTRPADRPGELAGYLQTLPAWNQAWQHRQPPRVVHWAPVATEMGAARWPVAELPDVAALADYLDLDLGELAWFADVRSLERRVAPALRHYRWWVQPKRGGVRVLAAPKPRLKQLQRRLLSDVVGVIPVHDAAHGSVPGRSVRTATAPHAGRQVVIRADLESYFASIQVGRVWGVLCNAGLPEPVAHAITGLVTTAAPVSVLGAVRSAADPAAADRLRRWLRDPHLPQGAPTSPALANLVAYSLDRRLAGLAARFGARYTRYVDDLTFSGGRSLGSARSRFVQLVDDIVRDEGFRLNDRKTVVLGASGRQALLGAVVNDRPTLARPERDALRALLHNCAVHGWRSQSRGRPEFRAYVLGRVAWAAGLDPVFGARLHTACAAIDWT